MVVGSYIIALAAVAAVLTTISYLMVARGNKSYLLTSQWFYYITTGLVIFAVFYLTYLFLNNHFEYSYIAGYSSIDLATNFKITSLWAGQEGSFLLWIVFGVLLGLWVKSKAKEQVGWVMFYYMIGQLFLFTLLNISSPFKLNSIVPLDGQGLNPLLQNFWMQIHPPVVFLGYAATFVPFAFALAALTTNKYDNWMKLTFPWAIFSVFTLGVGIILGGYWAYETLGWGGFWGWDPVENASLVPWLGSIALVHGMLLERKRGSFKKTNLFLAMTTFLMVIYGTFLTRSGVLADFSVHSFVDLGLNAYLAAFLIGFSVLSYGLLIYRGKSIHSEEPSKSPVSREFAVYLGMLFLVLSAFLILLGTSSPLITRVLSEPSAVDMSYYTLTNLPIGILLGIVLGLSALLSWKGGSGAELKRKLVIPVAAALLIALLSLILGIHDITHLIFIFTSGFALTGNLILVLTRYKRGFKFIQPDLIHTGFAMMFIGIVVSSAYSTSEKMALSLNQPEEFHGFNLIFNGSEKISAKKERVDIFVERGNRSFTASPVFVQSNQGVVRSPFIKKYLLYDLYLSPEEIKTIHPEHSGNTLTISRGQTHTVDNLEVTFVNFDQSGAHMEDGVMTIGAELKVKTKDGKTESVTPVYKISGTEPELIPARIPGSDKNVFLMKISADAGIVVLGFTDKPNADEFKDQVVLIIEATKKPLINFVWLGLILIMFGSGYATFRRIKEV